MDLRPEGVALAQHRKQVSCFNHRETQNNKPTLINIRLNCQCAGLSKALPHLDHVISMKVITIIIRRLLWRKLLINN